MFILSLYFFFVLVDYIQDASWLTDGDAFTLVFFPPFFFFFVFFFFIKKTSEGREAGRTGTAGEGRVGEGSGGEGARHKQHAGHWVT